MIKRVQLTLTLLSRLASSLNEDNLNPEDDLNEFNSRQNSGAQSKAPKLTATREGHFTFWDKCLFFIC